MIDPDDPLAGANPVSREQIDVLPLHGARRELLGEIMSMPSNATSTPGRSRVLLAVAAAAVIAVLAGGAWFAVSGVGPGGSDREAPVAGGSSGTSASGTASATATAAPADAVLNQKACDRLRKRATVDSVRVVLTVRKLAANRDLRRVVLYIKTRQGRWVRIGDERCRYVDPDSRVGKRLSKIRRLGPGPVAVMEGPPLRRAQPAPRQATPTVPPTATPSVPPPATPSATP